MTFSKLVDKAMHYAYNKHIGQFRKDGETPYITHPAAVAQLLYESGVREQNTLSAAWLHDVVEDTNTTVQDIERQFGTKVANLVDAVTRRENEPREDYLNRLIKSGKSAILIKISDAYHNLQTINCVPNKKQRMQQHNRLMYECKKYYLPIARKICPAIYRKIKIELKIN